MDDDENYDAWEYQLENEQRRQIEHNEHQEKVNGICIDQS
jgi:hypothetical protein